MESTDMDQGLLSRSGRNFLRKHWRIMYVVAGLVTGCCLTVGFSYLFLSLEKETGHGNKQTDVSAFSDALRLLEKDTQFNRNASQNGSTDSSYLERMLTTPDTANYTYLMKSLFEGYMESLFTKKESYTLTRLLQNIRNDSLKEMKVIKKTREEIMVMIENLKNISCPSNPQDIATTTPATTGPCRHDETLYNDHCYYFEDRGHMWDNAQKDCNERNSNLVTIERYSEWQWLKQKVDERQYSAVWIGAHDKVTEGYWKWVSDNSKVTYTRWDTGEPNNDARKEHCASMKRSRSYRWNDLPCNFLCNYVCER